MRKVEKYLSNELKDVNNKKVIVTGANSGLGFCICDHLLSKHAHIVMACRNEKRANDAKNKLLVKYPDAKIDIVLYDQSSLESIEVFVKDIINNHSDFFAFVLNAGVFRPKKGTITKDGFPLTSGVNFLGTLYIVELLQEYLSFVNEEKRIIIQGSVVTRFSKKYRKLDFDKAYLNEHYNLFKQYCLSKYAAENVYYYYMKNNINPNVKYLLSEPGIANSNIIREFKKWFIKVATFLIKRIFHTSEMGALTTCYLVCNHVANGTHMVPKHFFTCRGLPKKFYIKDKRMSDEIILHGLLEINDKR